MLKDSSLKEESSKNHVRLSAAQDSAFNLTISYKRDSDVQLQFNDIENMIKTVRMDPKTHMVLEDDQVYLDQLVASKNTTMYNTAWPISNGCLEGETPGAVKRWKFGQSLIKALVAYHNKCHVDRTNFSG